MFSNFSSNELVWQPTNRAGHVESYFCKLNDLKQGLALWTKFTIYSPENAPELALGEVWAIFFDSDDPGCNLGIKQSFPMAECQIGSGRRSLKFGPNQFSPGHVTIDLENEQGRRIQADLDFTTSSPHLEHFPYEWMYTAKIPKSKALTPYIHERFSGDFRVDKREVRVDNVPGMQGHNWGREHAHRYAWAHCGAFEGAPNVWFEGLSAKVKIGPFTSPWLSLAYLYDGEKRYDFNRGLTLFSRKIALGYNRWAFQLENQSHILRGELGEIPEMFAGLKYYNPTGVLSYCLNSKVANCELTLIEKRGGHTQKFRSVNGAALEILTKDEGHGVRVWC